MADLRPCSGGSIDFSVIDCVQAVDSSTSATTTTATTTAKLEIGKTYYMMAVLIGYGGTAVCTLSNITGATVVQNIAEQTFYSGKQKILLKKIAATADTVSVTMSKTSPEQGSLSILIFESSATYSRIAATYNTTGTSSSITFTAEAGKKYIAISLCESYYATSALLQSISGGTILSNAYRNVGWEQYNKLNIYAKKIQATGNITISSICGVSYDNVICGIILLT